MRKLYETPSYSDENSAEKLLIYGLEDGDVLEMDCLEEMSDRGILNMLNLFNYKQQGGLCVEYSVDRSFTFHIVVREYSYLDI